MLTDQRFLIGLAVGVVGTWLYHSYVAGKAMGGAKGGTRKAQG